MGLGRAVVAAIVEALDTEPRLRRLQQRLRSRPASRKCSPATDSGLGYILTQLAAGTPITYVDLTSSARVHFWRTRATEAALRAGSLVILHGAK
eukprot:2273871-Prymnesium_polylepis.1